MSTFEKNRLQLFYRARQTCLEMLSDRHYNVPSYLKTITEIEFINNFNNYSLITSITDNKSRPVIVYLYNGTDKTTLFDQVANILENKKESLHLEIRKSEKDNESTVQGITGIRLFIIYDQKDVGNNLVNLCNTYIGDPNHIAPFIEVFSLQQLIVNPTKHIYQPKWRLLSEEEANNVLHHYEHGVSHLNRNLFPSVCIDDPINRYYGGKPPGRDGKGGDIYEIIRDGVGISYRKVSSKRMNI